MYILWIVIDRLSIIWKSDLFDIIIKTGILSGYSHVSTIVWQHHLVFNEAFEKKKWELHKYVERCFEQVLEAAHHKIIAVRPLAFNLTNKKKNKLGTAG